MKFIEASVGTQATLLEWRGTNHHFRAVAPPDGDLWWNDGEHCSVCGSEGRSYTGLVRDHCHVSGFHRGWLCRSCNAGESGCEHAEVWDCWRRHAPLLVDREFFYNSNGYRAHSRWFSDEDALRLDIGEMLEFAERWQRDPKFRKTWSAVA